MKFIRLSSFALPILLLAGTALAQQATPHLTQADFDLAAGPTSSFGFEEFDLSAATSTGFQQTFTELDFVNFNAQPNFKQEVIEGSNVGSPNNNVYLTVASDKSLPIADITFGLGVTAVAFDLKDDAGNGTAADVPYMFTINLFSNAQSLGSFVTSTIPGGTMFTFNGFTSSTPITEITISSGAVSPNLDLVLDNFQVSAQAVPEPTSALLLVCGLLILGGAVHRRGQAKRS